MSKNPKLDIIVKMVRENTGSNMLDSGQVYGYKYDSAKRIDYSKVPYSYIRAEEFEHINGEHKKYFECHVSMEKFLEEALGEYDAKLTYNFKRFSLRPIRKDDSWIECLEQFVEYNGWEVIGGGNTYNDESFLDGVFQYDLIEKQDGSIITAIQTHNGCDVRGGYSMPRFFDGDIMEDIGLPIMVFGRCNCASWDIDYFGENSEVTPEDYSAPDISPDDFTVKDRIPFCKHCKSQIVGN